MDKLQTITIDRAKWRRGKSKMKAGITQLFDPTSELMCCLGFHATQACGVSRSDLANKGAPCALNFGLAGLTHLIGGAVFSNSTFAAKAMSINDNYKLSERQREMQLKAHAKKHGYRYIFTGKTPKRLWKKRPSKITT